jgi:hypothetical protein
MEREPNIDLKVKNGKKTPILPPLWPYDFTNRLEEP